jgi:hypothetical protein
MKRVVLAVLALVAVALLAGSAAAQGNPRGTAKLMLKGQAISVEYGRPALKGRTAQQMLEQLKPGDFWRLGADKSTTFSAALNLAFDHVTIPKGDYSLWASRDADGSWKLVFNKQVGQWGTRHDAAQDIASVPLKEAKAAKPAEMVTITLTKAGAGGVITIQWGDMKLTANFEAGYVGGPV